MTPDDATLTTPETETPAPDAAPVESWAADSDALPLEPETQAEPEAADEPEAAPPPAAERGENGQFKAKGKGKPRSDPQARVEQATGREAAAREEARQAREEAAQLRARLEALERQPRPAPPPAPVTPEEETNKFWESPIETARRLAREEATQALQQFRQEQAAHAAEAAFLARHAEFVKDHPDYETVVRQAPQVPLVMLEAIRQSPLGPHIAYDLGTHPEDCAQLAQELRTLGGDAVPLVRRMLEARVSAAAAPVPDSARALPRSSAAPPINRVGGTASAAPVDPDDLEFGPEYIRLENARELKQRAAGRW